MPDRIDLQLVDVDLTLGSDRQRLLVSAGDVEVFVEFSRRDSLRCQAGMERVTAALVDFVRDACAEESSDQPLHS